MSALEGPKADATETPHFPKEPEVLGNPSKFFGALRAQRITPPTLASGGRARRTFRFPHLPEAHLLASNWARAHGQFTFPPFPFVFNNIPLSFVTKLVTQTATFPYRGAESTCWSSGGSPPGIPGLRSRFRASSRGFPGKFLDGMAQN